MRPSEENRMLFWTMERRMRSFVAVQVMTFVSGCDESHPDLLKFELVTDLSVDIW